MRVDDKFLAVNGKSNFDGTVTAETQHDGNVLTVDGFPFFDGCLLYTSPSPRDATLSRMPSSA